jgi:hypothetical protein
MAQGHFEPLPPAVIVHGARHLRIALAPCLPVTLLSAPGAASYAGCLWWLKLFDLAENPAIPHLLDCGDAAGRALEAMRIGQKRIVLRTNAVGFPHVRDAAVAMGVFLTPQPPPALNLATYRAESRLIAWLTGTELPASGVSAER